MISVYLYEDDGRLVPEWVAYASHDFHGADLRRRWDDRSELEVEGNHPVVYAGAGSHAAYFRRGEYQAEVPIPYSRRLRRWSETGEPLLAHEARPGRTTRDGRSGSRSSTSPAATGSPSGPGQPNEWTPNVIDETTPWVGEYRGLWGLYAQDPISGENAPAGPMYERDGSPRPSWFDPLGFAGLDQVPPPPREIDALEREQERIDERQRGARTAHPAGDRAPAGARRSSRKHARQPAPRVRVTGARSAGGRPVGEAQRAAQGALRERRRPGGLASAPRAPARRRGRTIRVRTSRMPPSPSRRRRCASTGRRRSGRRSRSALLLIGLAILILASPSNVWAELVVLVLAFIVAESVLRGTFARTVNMLAVLAALVAIAVLFVQYWELVVVALLLALAAFLLYQRFREFTG